MQTNVTSRRRAFVHQFGLAALLLQSVTFGQAVQNTTAAAPAPVGSAAASGPTDDAESKTPDAAGAVASPKATSDTAAARTIGTQAEPAAAAPEANAIANDDKDATDAAKEDISVQRLPDAAYPNLQVRGIRGGSLWFTFHGMQWPYMPKKKGEADLMFGLSGSVWVDTGYERIRAGSPSDSNLKYWLQQGRFVLRATPTYRVGRDWFVQGQAELVGNNDQSAPQPYVVDADDLWVRAGKWNVFDVQVGRFEAWELYHLGMGLDLNTFERRGAATDNHKPPDFYGTTYAYYRPSGAGNVATHLYFTKWLRTELLGRIGNDGGSNTIGGRGALVFDVGWMKLKAGAEYLKGSNRLDNLLDHYQASGVGGAAQFVIFPWVEFGANFATGARDIWDARGGINEEGSVTVRSYGGFLNARIIEGLVVGGGYNYTYLFDIHRDATGRVGEWSQTQYFGALQYALFSKLYLKAVVASAKAHFAPSYTDVNTLPFDNTMLSIRLRASYYF